MKKTKAVKNELSGFLAIALVLVAVNLSYYIYILDVDIKLAWMYGISEGLMLTLIFFITRTSQLVKITVFYLVLPYFLFFAGWLNIYISVVMLFIASAMVLTTIQQENEIGCEQAPAIIWQEILAFLAIVVWVNLSGTGGYGYQNTDHNMHNGRLQDLINYPWPVQYGEEKPLVYYVGYYLPAAAVGKLFGLSAAIKAIYIWAILGVTLVLRWLCRLIKQPLAPALILVFAFFGSQDILGFLFRLHSEPDTLLNLTDWPRLLETHYSLDFWTPIFIGNFLSNTFQLYWAPHQIVAGWLVAALSMNALENRDNRSLIFYFSLLCLWAPLIMLAFLPSLVAIYLINTKSCGIARSFSLQNIFAITLLTPLFLVFYASGSVVTNPFHWTIALLHLDDVMWLVVFYMVTWGLYVLACMPYIWHTSPEKRIFVLALIINFVLLSQFFYGEYSDLISRGSASLGFCLFVLVASAWKNYQQQGRWFWMLILGFVIFLGSGSAILQNKNAFQHYGELQAPMRADQSGYSSEYLGRNNSFFGQYLGKQKSIP